MFVEFGVTADNFGNSPLHLGKAGKHAFWKQREKKNLKKWQIEGLNSFDKGYLWQW